MSRTIILLLALAAPAHAGKRRETAQYLSAGGAIVSSGLVLGSFLLGRHDATVNEPMFYTGLGTSLVTPSLGQIYAGQYVTWGMGIRALAAGLAIVAITTQTEHVACIGAQAGSTGCTELTGTGVALAGAFAIAYIGGTALDVMDAPDAVDRYNHSHVMVMPAVLPTPKGAAAGLYFSATY
jgi:hypothetical protein